MTDQEIRIAVAKIAGFTNIHQSSPTGDILKWYGRPPGAKRISKFLRDPRAVLPDYPNDANAVIPLLEKWGDIDICRDSHHELGPWSVGILVSADGDTKIGFGDTFARAACEALLKVHGKWRE